MKRKRTSWRAGLAALLGLVAAFAWASPAAAQPGREALAGFEQYVGRVEGRLNAQHRTDRGFLTPLPAGASLAAGKIALEQLTPDGGEELSGALLHHWRGTAFVPGATAAQFEELLRDFAAYPKVFAPQVERARVLPDGEVTLRVVQKHVITVVLDTTYEVSFGALDSLHRYSASRSTHVSEIANAGTSRERALTAAEAHGFLWRLNTYWSYEQRDGGLYLQIETVSLTRGIPTGLGWAVRPFIESVPRESLAFTLRAASRALDNEDETRRTR